MGKRASTSRQLVLEYNEASSTNKRLRAMSQDSAALTLLSLKREAVRFTPTSFPMVTPLPTTISISRSEESNQDKEPSVPLNKAVTRPVSRCSSVTDDDESVSSAHLQVGFPKTPAMPLRKPTLCHLNQTKAADKPVGKPVGKPLPAPPALPSFLVLSSYAPYAVPRQL